MHDSAYYSWFTSYEYTQGLHCYACAFNLDRCVWNCNTLNDLSNKVCVPSKTEDKPVQLDYRNKWVKNVNKVYMVGM